MLSVCLYSFDIFISFLQVYEIIRVINVVKVLFKKEIWIIIYLLISQPGHIVVRLVGKRKSILILEVNAIV